MQQLVADISVFHFTWIVWGY